jgi:hypothetical protein
MIYYSFSGNDFYNPLFEPGMKGIVQITFIIGIINDSHFTAGINLPLMKEYKF